MKKPGRAPRFLPEILQAIYELKETGGSNSNKIVSHVKSNLKGLSLSSTPRNLSTQVRRALNHATTNGIVKQRAGKFRINTALFNPFKDCMECRRRRKRTAKKRTRRRSRKHAIVPSVKSYSEFNSDSEPIRYRSDSESDEFPVRVLRRRRKSKKAPKRRRRRRRSHHEKLQPSVNSDNKETFSNDAVYPDDLKNGNDLTQHQCDNPECLCNVKDEYDEVQNYDPPM